MHGGTVGASAGEGKGATFTVHLPLTPLDGDGDSLDRDAGRADGAPPRQVAADGLAGVKVLVVDNQADARDLIARVLEAAAAVVLSAASADEAIGLVETERPDVLVSDIGMPDVDGYELLRRVRALGPDRGGRVPAIALTASARREDRTRLLQPVFIMSTSRSRSRPPCWWPRWPASQAAAMLALG